MLRESEQQKRPSDSWRKNTNEGCPTAKNLVQICTLASPSTEWKHTNWPRAGFKTTHLKMNVEFRLTVFVCLLNDWISNTSSLNKFSSPMRCQIEQVFWFYFCIFFSRSTAFLECLFSLIFTFTFSFLSCHHLHWFFYSSFFSVWQACLIFFWLIQCASHCSYCSCFSYFCFEETVPPCLNYSAPRRVKL